MGAGSEGLAGCGSAGCGSAGFESDSLDSIGFDSIGAGLETGSAAGSAGKSGRSLWEFGGKSNPLDPIPPEILVDADVSAWMSRLFSL